MQRKRFRLSMKPSPKELSLFLGGGALALGAFGLAALNAVPEALAGVLIGVGVLIAMIGSVVMARRQTSPWSRRRRTARRSDETRSLSV
jgi:hypothetical protein